MKKKIWFISALAAISIVIGIGIIKAYLSDNEKKPNQIEIGENKVTVEEAFPDKDKVQKTGGNEYQKEVEVKNTGNVPCYIRVFMEFPDSYTANKSFLSWDGETYYSAASSLPSSVPTITGKTISSGLYSSQIASLTKWKYEKLNDNCYYYYYTEPLVAGEETDKLLDSVLIYNAENQDLKETDLYIYTESVQTKDINGTEYTDYKDAWNNYYLKSSS